MWICCRKRLLQTCPGLLTRDLFWCSVLPDKGLKCPVCLLEFEEQETVREMPCKHLFHAGCILPWLGKVTLRSIVQILFWLLGILLLNPLHVCNRRRTPVRSADLNYRPTIQNMRSLKKTRWDWSSSSNNAQCVVSPSLNTLSFCPAGEKKTAGAPAGRPPWSHVHMTRLHCGTTASGNAECCIHAISDRM